MSETYNKDGQLKIAQEELERAQFLKDKDGKIAQRVAITGDVGILEGVKYDKIQASYPDSATEIYEYSLAGVSQASLEVVYTSSSKKNLSSIRKL